MIPHNWHRSLPWKRLRHVYRVKRTNFFDLPRQSGTYLRVQTDSTEPVREMHHVFGGVSYAPRWEVSYCRGEDLNLARVEYSERNGYDEVWWQVHVRGYVSGDDEIELSAHYETETTEHPVAHLDGVGYDIARGLQELREVLEFHGYGYEEVYVDPDAESDESDDSRGLTEIVPLWTPAIPALPGAVLASGADRGKAEVVAGGTGQ